MRDNLSFVSLAGQEKVKAVLSRSLASGRIPHAYLFRGPDGVGKKLTALLTAARLNCLTPEGSSGCGACSSCKKLVSGNHPDVVVVSPENGTIKIDRIRELCRSLSYPPYESEMRIVIIEDVHTMTPQAANSLLKTLEEPPERNLLILTAESSRELLPTIVSRCQAVTFYGLPVEDCSRVIEHNQPEIGYAEARLLAEMAGGSPGTALVLQQKELVGHYRSIVALLESDLSADQDAITPVLETAARLAALKEDMPLVLGLLRIWARDQLAAAEQGADFESQKLKLLALDRAQRQLDRNCNRTLVSEVLLFNLQSPVAEVP